MLAAKLPYQYKTPGWIGGGGGVVAQIIYSVCGAENGEGEGERGGEKEEDADKAEVEQEAAGRKGGKGKRKR